ncbi:MAG TPA: hypothetical protein VII06_26595 [Chloroflexota bacterium]
MKAKTAAPLAPHATAPLGSRSRARLALAVRAAAAAAERGRPGGGLGRGALVALWLGLCALLAGALLTAAPAARAPGGEPPAEIQRLGPAEDDEPAADVPAILAARLVALAPADDSAEAPTDAPPTGLYLSSGGAPQPLRAAPDRSAEALVQVPDHAALDDLGEITPDGAWRHVAWDGWEGWISAGLLLRRPD